MAMMRLNLCQSREKARALIMAGQVLVNGQRVDKAGAGVNAEDKIEIKGDKLPFVSRGGLKLKKAMESFPIDLGGKVCIDIGASTGGFTDCMLQNGAAKVYAVDVGYGQLAWSLRTDPRVVSMERTNIRYVTPDMLAEQADFASVDVSFISLKLVLPTARELLTPGGKMVCLIKPQFEAGREKVGKKGVVREKSTHIEVIEAFLETAKTNGFGVLGLDYSPVKGPEGNIEYLAYIEKDAPDADALPDAKTLVEASHQELDK
ncbi:MAG: TlyA family RNA methyltransferase [Oscillospiraceae bacterium]|nr:TlyA family RNA methyltransferase [Oscillospiraceae bacterium]